MGTIQLSNPYGLNSFSEPSNSNSPIIRTSQPGQGYNPASGTNGPVLELSGGTQPGGFQQEVPIS